MPLNSTAMNAQPIEYQLEIDGLRAIAVLSVVLFHVEFTWIPGGFVGVDVFFVISGFLITRLLLKEIRAGSFSFRQFYLRRIRRLGPALVATLLCTFIVSAFFLTPDHFQRFSGALLASLFSLSNFYFWAESGYFDASAELKPLLHTWSLSVEEQFYLVWPALIFLLGNRLRWVLPVVILLLAVASLQGAVALTAYNPSASFFLMPFRVYEFALGAGLALLPALVTRNLVKELLCVLGLLMLGYSMFAFDQFTPFPDIYALLPCIGTVLLILGGNARFLGMLLRNPLSVWIGSISYSLYLVHWPIVVLYKHITFEDVVVGKTRIALLLLMLMAAVVLYYGVERRFRLPATGKTRSIPHKHNRWASTLLGRFSGSRLARLIASPMAGDPMCSQDSQGEKQSSTRFSWGKFASINSPLSWLAVPIFLSLAAFHAYAINAGWPERFDPAVVRAIGNIEDKQLIRREYIDGEQALSNLPFDAQAQERVLVMGDSHATDMFNALYLNLKNDKRLSIRRLEIDDVCLYLFAAQPNQQGSELSASEALRCGKHFDAVQTSELLSEASRIIVSTRWEQSSFAQLGRFIQFLRSRNKQSNALPIVLMSRTAEFKTVPSLILQYGLDGSDRIGIDQRLAQARITELDTLNEELSALSKQLQVDYVNKLPFLCSGSAKVCDALNEDGLVLYTDYGHWTMEGARLFGQRMLRDDKTALLLTGLSGLDVSAAR